MLLVIIARLNIFLWGPRLFRLAPLENVVFGAEWIVCRAVVRFVGGFSEGVSQLRWREVAR